MARVVLLAMADLPDEDMQSLVDAGHEVVVMHPQKASVFALIDGLGGSVPDGEEPKADKEEEEEPKEEPPEEEETAEEPPEEVEEPPKGTKTEESLSLFDVSMPVYKSRHVDEPTMFVPSIKRGATGWHVKLAEGVNMTYATCPRQVVALFEGTMPLSKVKVVVCSSLKQPRIYIPA
jgi:hypothetical protein